MALDTLTQRLLDDLRRDREKISTTAPSLPVQRDNETTQRTLYEDLFANVGERQPYDVSNLKEGDKASGIHHAVGAGVWEFVDSALFDIPGLLLEGATGWKPYQEGTEGIAKMGEVVGAAAGFLTPMKWVSKGIKYAGGHVIKAGTGRVTAKAIELGAKAEGARNVGSVDKVSEALKKGFDDPIIKGESKWFANWPWRGGAPPPGAINSYELSLEAVGRVEAQMMGGLAKSLKQAFPTASTEDLAQIVKATTDGLKSRGVHINTIGRYVENKLGRALTNKHKELIAGYAAKQADFTMNFATYNLIQDGVYAIAGEKDFEPGKAIKDAIVFSALLPAVEAIGGGGKVHVTQQVKKLWRLIPQVKRKMRKGEFDKMTSEEANAVLRILSKDNYLADGKSIFGFGKSASRRRPGDVDIDREEAIAAVKAIYNKVDVDKMWKEFYKEAGEDFVASTGRMLVGGLYFNSAAMLDVLKVGGLGHHSAEELFAHFLVGGYFTKIKKPIVQSTHKHVASGTEERLRVLEYLGMDSSNYKVWASSFREDMSESAVYTGVLGNENVKSLEMIFEKAGGKQREKDWEAPATAIRDTQTLTQEFKIVLEAFEIYDKAFKARSLHEEGSYDKNVRLEDFTLSELTNIKNKLESIEILDGHFKGEKLSEQNINRWKREVEKTAIENSAKTYLEYVMDVAERLQLEVERPETIDIDKPIRMSRLADDAGNFGRHYTDPKYSEINNFRSTVEILAEMGLIDFIPQQVGQKRHVNQIENLESVSREISERATNVVESLRVNNFSEHYPKGMIEIHDNGFLRSIGEYKGKQRQREMVNISQGRTSEFTQREARLYDVLSEVLGENSPKDKIRQGEVLTVTRPEGMSDKEWAEKSEKRTEVEEQLTMLADIWGVGRSDGKLKMDKEGIPFEHAENLIDMLKMEGHTFDRYNVENIKRAIYGEILENPNLTAKHVTLVESIRDYQLGSVEPVGRDNYVIKIVDRKSVEQALLSQYESTSPEYKELLRKYDDIIREIDILVGSHIDFKTHASFDVLDNIDMAINGIHRETAGFQKRNLQEIEMMREKIHKDVDSLTDITKLFDIIHKPREEGQEGPRERQLMDSEQRLDSALRIIEKLQANPPEVIPEAEWGNHLKILAEGLISEHGQTKISNAVKAPADAINRIMLEQGANLGRANSVLEEIIFDLQNNSRDRIAFEERKGRLLSRLREHFKDTELEQESIEARNLNDLLSIYGKSNRIGEAIEILKESHRSWKSAVSEEKYFETQERIREAMDDYASYNVEKGDIALSASGLSNKYGRYSDSMKHDAFNQSLERLRESLYIHASNPNELNREMIQQAKQSIRNDVSEALINKHGEGTEGYQREWNEFLQVVYPQIISNQIGRESVPSMRLSVGFDGKPTLVLDKVTVGSGLIAEFKREMKELGIDVLYLESTGVHEGRKVNINEVEKIDEIVSRAKIQDASLEAITRHLKGLEIENRNDTNVEPFREPVRIVVSQNSSLIVPRDQAAGLLNSKFREWYESKLEWYDAKEMRLERNNFENLYSHILERTQTSATSQEIKSMIRALYFDRVSSNSFDEMIAASKNQGDLKSLSTSFFKYVGLAEATGAKVRVSERFLREMVLDSREEPSILNERQSESIQNYFENPNLKVIGIRDEFKDSQGVLTGPLSSKKIVLEEIKRMKENGYEGYSKEMVELAEQRLKSLNSSSINAQSFISHRLADLLYLPKGRRTEEGNKYGTAGVKPTGWFSRAGESILLKTNFIYDPVIADYMQSGGKNVDILTTESAAKAFNKEMVEISKGEYESLSSKSIENIADIAIRKSENKHESTMKLEDIFLGKVEDRKGLTSVTYSFSDFLSKEGFQSYKEFGRYSETLNDGLRNLGELVLGAGDRHAVARHLTNALKDRNELIEESGQGITVKLLEAGLDPNSPIIHQELKRMMLDNLMSNLRKPKATGASYSILTPYINGTIPIYRTNSTTGVKELIKAGGKKLSYEDGFGKDAAITNFDSIQYLMSIPSTKGKKDRRDIRLGKEQGKWVIYDPLKQAKVTDKNIQQEISKIENIQKEMLTEYGNPLFGQLYNRLRDHNLDNLGKGKNRIYLSSLSLRMPNLGGDVAVHRVEGFYRREQGNIVGVNVFDIAQIHQADFDVDAMFSYNMSPSKMGKELHRFAGHSIEAYQFPTIETPLNFFETGPSGRAGSNSQHGDSFDAHNKLFLQSKKNFGVVKKLSTSLSGILRFNETANNFTISLGEMGITHVKGPKEVSEFLQTYKNVLQSIIDSAKRPNFAGASPSEQITRYLLFGEKPELYNLTAEMEKNFEMENFQGFFKGFDKIQNTKQQEVLKSSVLEFIRQMNKPQRLLTDVFDVDGRRPPSAEEIQKIRSDYYDFAANPDKYIFDALSFKYRGRSPENVKMREALNRMFFGENYSRITLDMKNLKEFRKENKTGNLIPTESIFNIPSTMKREFMGSTVAGGLVMDLSQSKKSFNGFTQSRSPKGDKAFMEAGRAIENLDILLSISGDSRISEKLYEQDAGVFEGGWYDKFYKELRQDQHISTKNLERYALLQESFRIEKESLQSFIKKAGKHLDLSHHRAKRKISHIEHISEHLRELESDMVSKVIKNPQDHKKTSERLNIRRFNYTNKSRGGHIKNNGNNIMFVYKKTKNQNGNTRFQEVGYVKSGSSKWFSKGDYYVMKNPIVSKPIRTSEALDGWSLLEATGDVQIHHLGFRNDGQMSRFVLEKENLQKTLGMMASETFRFNKKNPNAQENWVLDRALEDAMVKVFMDRWTNPERRKAEMNLDNNQVTDLVRFMMKPDPVFNTYVTAGGAKLPVVKVNKRMFKAMSMWMINNGHGETLNRIVSIYGKDYRRRYDNVLSDTVTDGFTSQLYRGRKSKTVDDPLFDLAIDRGYLHDPAFKHHYGKEVESMSARARKKYDENGDLEFVRERGTYQKMQNNLEYYIGEKDLIKRIEKEC